MAAKGEERAGGWQDGGPRHAGLQNTGFQRHFSVYFSEFSKNLDFVVATYIRHTSSVLGENQVAASLFKKKIAQRQKIMGQWH